MNKKADAIIIGAGVIGSSVAFELAKRGYKTLNIDKLPTSGYGSTSNSCAIVRAHYSTWDGVAMAYEGFFYWDDWKNYLGVEDERGMIKYMKTGSIMFKLQGEDHSKKSLKFFEEIGVEHEIWDLEKLKERMPIYSHDQFDGTTRPDDDEHFFDKTGKKIEGAIFTPGSGYVSDPQLSSHNLQVAAEANGGEFLFNNEIKEIRQEDGKVLGVTLKTGEQIDAPIVVNVAGPHSFVINRMAGVEEEMNIKTKALRHEVHHVLHLKALILRKTAFILLMETTTFISARKPETLFSSAVKTHYAILKNGLKIRIITTIKLRNPNGGPRFTVVHAEFRT